ncbi:RNA polymerase sigma factor [Luteimonas sp. R10]|uniref:RNA polymerase sigma factor n=1 Tax=Luteimonas sp. R10 TaxID=3108176 RepID=UPI0030908746|nr:RNA polymerase sigma factor [Luteimonas sp. R10]
MSEGVRLGLLDYLTRNYDELKRRLARTLRSPELADEALHDTWLRIRRLEDRGPVLNPRAFLLRAAVNNAINALRSRSHRVPGHEIDAVLDVADSAPGPEQSAMDGAELDELLRILRRMPRRRRDILLLVRWEGLPQKEVARRLGVSLSTVEHEVKRAIDHCAARMGRHDE